MIQGLSWFHTLVRTSGSQTLQVSLSSPSLQSLDRSSSSAINLDARCSVSAWLALQQLQPYCRQQPYSHTRWCLAAACTAWGCLC